MDTTFSTPLNNFTNTKIISNMGSISSHSSSISPISTNIITTTDDGPSHRERLKTAIPKDVLEMATN